jgi:hypothetical protein
VGTVRPGGVAQQQRRDDPVRREDHRNQQERERTAVTGGELHRRERRDGRAAHPHAEDAQRQPPARGRVPGVDQRHADGERRAAETEEEATNQEQRVGVAEEPDEQHLEDRQEAHGREHHPSPESVGQRPDRDAANRADDHGHRDEQRLLERGEAQLLTVGDTERADQRPRPEVDEEAHRRQDDHHRGTAPLGARGDRRPVAPGPARHGTPPTVRPIRASSPLRRAQQNQKKRT